MVTPHRTWVSDTSFPQRKGRPQLQWRIGSLNVDGDELESLIFTAIPGVNHRIERSTDLTTWQPVTEDIYGLGHEIAIGMREIEDAGSPHPNTPSSPATGPQPQLTHSSVTLRPAVGGGIVVSILDSNTTFSSHLIVGQLDAGWGSYPLQQWTFGSSLLFTFVPSLDPITPPSPFAPTAESATILTLVTDNLAQMNSQIATQITAQAIAPITPAVPGPRQFFRIVSDWSLDSDGDGSLDWLEWQQANDGSPIGLNGATSNAFNADTNSDGILDGLQIDSDSDGVVDQNDPAPNGVHIDWIKSPLPRYAVFPVTTLTFSPTTSEHPAIIGNSRGEILVTQPLIQTPSISSFVWRAGAIYPLPRVSQYADAEDRVFSLDDFGNVYGSAEIALFPMSQPRVTTAFYWRGPGFAAEKIGQPYERVSLSLAAPNSSLNDNNDFGRPSPDGRIQASIEQLGLEQPGDILTIDNTFSKTLKFDTGGLVGETAHEYHYLAAYHPISGVQLERNSLYDPSQIPSFPHSSIPKITSPAPFAATFSGYFNRLCPTPSGGWLAVIDSGSRLSSKMGGGWSTTAESESVQMQDIALNGVALRYGLSTGFRNTLEPFWFDGRRYSTAQMIPSLAPEHVDATSATLTGGGHIILAEEEFSIGRVSLFLGSPFAISDEAWASGVDDFSLNSADSTSAVDDKYWIMVPQDSSNAFFLHSEASLMQQYDLEFLNGQCTPPQVATTETFIHISGDQSSGGFASDNSLGFILTDEVNEVHALNSPIGLKVMPRRDITVGLWPVNDAAGDGPDMIINEAFRADLEAELNDIFGKQTNVFFTVTLGNAIDENWDIGTGAEIGFQPPASISPGDQFFHIESFDEKTTIHTAVDEVDFDINLYVLPVPLIFGTTHQGQGGFNEAAGETDRLERRVWIAGYKEPTPEDRAGVIRTCSHEIGHVLIGIGHPNEASGPAQLPNTDHKRRLMVGGPAGGYGGVNPNQRDKLLVKQEWDAIAETIEAEPILLD